MNQIMWRMLLIVTVCIAIPQTLKGQDESSAGTFQDATTVVDQYKPLTGKQGPHPDFILPSIDNDEKIQLSKFRGKKVLLLHFASW